MPIHESEEYQRAYSLGRSTTDLKELEQVMEKFREFLSREPNNALIARHFIELISRHLYMLARKNDLAALEDLEKMKALSEKFPEAVLIGEEFLVGIMNVIGIFGAKFSDKIEEWMGLATKIFERNTRMLNYAEQWMKCAANSIIVYTKIGQFDKAEKLLESLVKYADEWSAPAVLVPATAAAYNLLIEYNNMLGTGKITDTAKMREIYSRIKYLLPLVRKYGKGSETVNGYVYIGIALSQTIYNAGKLGEMGDLREFWKELENMYLQFSKLRNNKDFVESIRNAAHYVYKYIEEDDPLYPSIEPFLD
ncbi:MAG: hypothetical protein QXL15_03590 [Candidatus Korarchaeota archaeon]